MAGSKYLLAAAALVMAHGQATAEGADGADEEVQWVTPLRARYEIAVGAHLWPTAGELDPVAGGTFDDVGLDINLAAHWPAMRFGKSELLVGVDLGVLTGESNVRFIAEDLSLRGGYLTPSVKWMAGGRNRYSLDAGIGYYMVDIAEVVGGVGGFYETQLWESSSIGGYLGASVDFGAARPDRRHGLMLAMKVHFFDVGRVGDDDAFLPAVLGSDSGSLGGPVYSLLVGYRWR